MNVKLNSTSGRLAIHLILGGLLGFLILHPGAMLILNLNSTNDVEVFSVSTNLYARSHLAMSIYFSFLGASAGLLHAFSGEKLFRRVKILEGLLPICAWCSRIEDKAGKWMKVESYVSAETDASFTHTICPSCSLMVEDQISLMQKRKRARQH